MKIFTTNDRMEQFKQIMAPCMQHIIDQQVIDDLTEMGFFIAPAAIRHHSNYEGGLFDHSFAVTKALLSLTKRLELKWGRPESPYIVGMFHDLCKLDEYYYSWESECWDTNPNANRGHGSVSVPMAVTLLKDMPENQKHLESVFYPRLTDEEVECIRWHMGAFDAKENWNKYGAAIEKFPNVLYTHTADMIAARVLGV